MPWTRPWRHRAGRGLLALGLALASAGPGTAASRDEPNVPDVAPNARAPADIVLGDDELIIREVFHSHLPGTLKSHALRLSLHPHLGDFTNKDHLRVTPGIRYGATKNWEISISSDLYVSHGRGDVPSFDNYGAASVELGTKVNLRQTMLEGWEIGTGFDLEFPTGHPPAELTDGLRHFQPYVTFSHRLESHRGLRVFWGLRLDLVTRTSVPGEFRKNALRDSSTGITGGFVIDRDNWHYTFETSFDTTRLITDTNADVFLIRPGVIWEILSRRHPGSRSNWAIGAAVSVTSGPGGTNLGGSLKVRYNLNLKRPRSPPGAAN